MDEVQDLKVWGQRLLVQAHGIVTLVVAELRVALHHLASSPCGNLSHDFRL